MNHSSTQLPQRSLFQGLGTKLFSNAWRVLHPIVATSTYLFMLPILYGFELFRPLRFGLLHANRFGHLAYNLEALFRRSQTDHSLPKNALLIMGAFDPANKAVVSLLRSRVVVLDFGKSKLLNAIYCFFLNRILRTKFYLDIPFSNKEHEEFQKGTPAFSFSHQAKKTAQEEMLRMGIKETDWYACVHSRDPAYKKTFMEVTNSARVSYRDCSIENYLPAARYIASLGGLSLRMGAAVEKPLSSDENSKIIDYATKFRSELMDIFLPSRCKFFLGNTSGLVVMAAIFDRPIVCANIIPFNLVPMGKHAYFIPKKLRRLKTGEFVPYKEIFEKNWHRFVTAEEYENAGLEVVENSGDEILDLVTEANAIIDGRQQVDQRTQKAYYDMLKPDDLGYGGYAVISSTFVKKNENLF